MLFSPSLFTGSLMNQMSLLVTVWRVWLLSLEMVIPRQIFVEHVYLTLCFSFVRTK